jgi:hypothetical protein
MLLQDLGCAKTDLSRALKGLERQGLAYCVAGDLEHRGHCGKNRKFASITDEGETWLKRQQNHNGKVSA